MHPTDLQAQLAQFTGSTTFTRHVLIPTLIMTEGVVFLAERAGAHWLTDAIASYQYENPVSAEVFQAWKLTADLVARSGVLTMTNGNNAHPTITQILDYTDFPLEVITLWLVNDGRHQVLMLPSEY